MEITFKLILIGVIAFPQRKAKLQFLESTSIILDSHLGHNCGRGRGGPCVSLALWPPDNQCRTLSLSHTFLLCHTSFSYFFLFLKLLSLSHTSFSLYCYVHFLILLFFLILLLDWRYTYYSKTDNESADDLNDLYELLKAHLRYFFFPTSL